jgi:NAD(P)-dependent dehydrogenase (short-subunit alcohol dehydrogenase family)
MPPSSPSATVFITGAAAGIGAATTRLLAADGYTVYAGVHKETGPLDGMPGVRQVPIDVTDPGSVAAAATYVAEAAGAGGLRALINNAGLIVQGPLELVPAADLQRQFAVNTLGAAYAVQAFLPLLRAGRGRVINISAPTARVPMPFLAPLSASKAGLVALSDALRLELARWGIPVIVIEPGATDTRIFAKAEAAAEASLTAADPALVALYSGELTAMAKAAARQRPRPADTVARTIAAAVRARSPRRRYVSGADARMAGLVSRLPAGARERLIKALLGIARTTAGAPAS